MPTTTKIEEIGMIKRALLVTLLLLSTNTFAGTALGKVTGYIPYSTGGKELLFVKIEAHVDSPTCNVTGRFTMSSSDLKYESTNAALLAAFMSGATVRAKGRNTCNNWSNSEDLSYVCLGSIPC
jgi:hypothetical protein